MSNIINDINTIMYCFTFSKESDIYPSNPIKMNIINNLNNLRNMFSIILYFYKIIGEFNLYTWIKRPSQITTYILPYMFLNTQLISTLQ